MNRSVISTIDLVLPMLPDGEPVKSELQQFRDSIFIELPESNQHLWRQASYILERCVPADQTDWLEWHWSVFNAWNGKPRTATPLPASAERRRIESPSLSISIRCSTCGTFEATDISSGDIVQFTHCGITHRLQLDEIRNEP